MQGQKFWEDDFEITYGLKGPSVGQLFEDIRMSPLVTKVQSMMYNVL